MRHLQVSVVVGVGFELVVAPVGSAARVGCARLMIQLEDDSKELTAPVKSSMRVVV